MIKSFKIAGTLTRNNIYDAMCDALFQCGWELHDPVSARKKVYKTRGESGKRATLYVHLDGETYINNSNYYSINNTFYTYWDAVAHIGYGKQYTYPYHGISADAQNAPYLFSGDKDIFIACAEKRIVMSGWSNENQIAFGYLKPFSRNIVQEVQAAAAAGSMVSVAVADSSDFVIGSELYCIVGADQTEGLQWGLIVAGVPDATHIVLQTLPVGVSAGAVIGNAPLLAFDMSHAYGIFSTFPIRDTDGIATMPTNASALVTASPQLDSHCDPGAFGFVAPVFMLYEAGTYYNSPRAPGYTGYMDEHIFYAINTYTVPEKTLMIKQSPTNQKGLATAVGADYAEDTAQAWTVDVHTGRTLAIMDQTGLYMQSVKILSNTANRLTLTTTFDSPPPVTGSLYYICDEAYRRFTRSIVRECVSGKVTY